MEYRANMPGLVIRMVAHVITTIKDLMIESFV